VHKNGFEASAPKCRVIWYNVMFVLFLDKKIIDLFYEKLKLISVYDILVTVFLYCVPSLCIMRTGYPHTLE